MRKTWNTHGLIPCANLNLTDALIGRVHKNKGLQFLSSCIIWKIPFCLNIWISQFFYSLSFLHTSRLKSTRVQNGKRQIWNIASNLRRHEGVELCGSRLYLFYCLPIYLQINLKVKSQRSQVYFAASLVLPSCDIENRYIGTARLPQTKQFCSKPQPRFRYGIDDSSWSDFSLFPGEGGGGERCA